MLRDEEEAAVKKEEEANGAAATRVVLVEARDVSLSFGPKVDILRGLNTFIFPGRCLAIMGPSGCGKTTLLHVLAGRHSSRATVAGEVLVNGEPLRSAAQFGDFGSVAPQDDTMLENLTSREHLGFIAALRRCPSDRTEELLSDFGLAERGDNLASTLSGGQRKRLSIAMEMVHSPAVLLVDEPTSGLDSGAARDVIRLLIRRAKRLCTSLALTIHQPAAEVFFMCESLLILAQGRVVFDGATLDSTKFFLEPPTETPSIWPKNPADVALALATEPDAADRWLRDGAPLYAREAPTLEGSAHPPAGDVATIIPTTTTANSARRSLCFRPHVFAVLFRRSFLQTYRLQGLIQVKAAFAASIFFGLSFYKQPNTQERASLIVASFFIMSIISGLAPGILTTLFITKERSTLQREYFNGLWYLIEYLPARLGVLYVVNLVAVTILCTVLKFMIGLRARLWVLIGVLQLCGMLLQTIGTAIGSLATGPEKAIQMLIPINLLSLVTAGFFYNIKNLTKDPQYLLYPIWYLSVYRYPFSICVFEEFHRGRFRKCTGRNCPYNRYAAEGDDRVDRDVVINKVLDMNPDAIKDNYVWAYALYVAGACTLTYLLIRNVILRV